MPTFPLIANSRLLQREPATEALFVDYRDRDIGNSEKPMDIAFVEHSTTLGTPQPVTLTTPGDRFFAVDGDRLIFECDVRNSDGATFGQVAITVGGVDTGLIIISSGDTVYTPRTTTVLLTGVARRTVAVTFHRTAGAGTVFCRALGIISRTFNSEA